MGWCEGCLASCVLARFVAWKGPGAGGRRVGGQERASHEEKGRPGSATLHPRTTGRRGKGPSEEAGAIRRRLLGETGRARGAGRTSSRLSEEVESFQKGESGRAGGVLPSPLSLSYLGQRLQHGHTQGKGPTHRAARPASAASGRRLVAQPAQRADESSHNVPQLGRGVRGFGRGQAHQVGQAEGGGEADVLRGEIGRERGVRACR